MTLGPVGVEAQPAIRTAAAIAIVARRSVFTLVSGPATPIQRLCTGDRGPAQPPARRAGPSRRDVATTRTSPAGRGADRRRRFRRIVSPTSRSYTITLSSSFIAKDRL